MADKATIVGTNDKGQFSVPTARSNIERVDVIDIDLVIQTKNGDRLILPGAAIEAMTGAPPAVHFTDGATSADALLAAVDKVQTPNTSIPAMTSLTEFDQKRTEGKKNRTADGSDKQADEAAQQAQAQQVAPLQMPGETTTDKLLSKADNLMADLRNKAFDPAPPKVYEPPPATADAPGSQPQTSKIPLYISMSEGNVVGVATDGSGHIFYGSGGPPGSSNADGLPTGDPLQYGAETLIGTAGADTFYADAFSRASGWRVNGATLLNNSAAYAALDKETGLAPAGTNFYYAKEFGINVAGYVRRIDTVTVTGLPSGVSIQGATGTSGGTWNVAPSDVIPNAQTLVMVYDINAMRALFNKDSNGDGIFDYVDVYMSVNITGMGTTPINVTKTFVVRFQDVDSSDDITNAIPVHVSGKGGGWSDVYVMPTAGAPQVIVTYAGSYNAAQTFAQNAATAAATADGNNTVYGGNSADTILAGNGNDVIYAYGGNDSIAVGNGSNTVWAGDGDDVVYSGTGNDTIYAGRGSNVVNDTGGNNIITVIASKTITMVDASGNPVTTTISGNGKDVVTISGNGNNTITVGDATDSFTDGDDTVTTATGTDIINVGDGNNKVTSADGNKTVTAGGGNDTITVAVGDHTITAGDGNNVIQAGNGNNTITAGSGTDTVTTGDGTDVVNVGDGVNKVTTGNGNKTVTAGSGADSITTGTGDDTITAGDGTNVIQAGSGNNRVTSGSGSDTVTSGDGTDIISVGDGVNKVTTGNGDKTITAGSGADRISTGTGNDTITAGDGDNIVTAGDGNNIITAGSGADTLVGGDGNDSIVAGDGNDMVYGGQGDNATLDGGGGTDWLSFNGIAASVINGTTVLADWLTNAGSISGVSLTTNASNAATTTRGTEHDAIANFENFIGSSGNDLIDLTNSTASGHTLYGLAGNDTLTGSSSADLIYGGVGNDTLLGKAGNDIIFTAITSLQTTTTAATLDGTTADDTLAVNTADGGAGADTLVGGDGSDYFIGANNEYADAAGNYDMFIGGAGTDTVDHSSFTANLVIDMGNHLGRINNGAYIGEYWGIEVIKTGSGGDSISSAGGNFTAYGNGGNDTFWSAAGTTAYYDGGTGYNEYRLSTGAEAIHGALGSDRVFYDGSARPNITVNTGLSATFAFGVYVNLDESASWHTGAGGALTDTTGASYVYLYNGHVWNGTTWVAQWGTNTSLASLNLTDTSGRGFLNYAAGDTYEGVEHIFGSYGNDVLIGNASGNQFFAASGNDAIYGLAGADALNMMWGGTRSDGKDFFDGGNDVVGVADAFTIALDGNGAITWGVGDLVNFSSGNDINRALSINIDSVSHTDSVATVGNNAGVVQGWFDTLVVANVEHVTGGNYADFIYGSAAKNVLNGGGGNDTIYGYGGDDLIYGGSGADSLDGGAGNDWVSWNGLGVGVEVYLTNADLNGDGVSDATGWVGKGRAVGQNGYDYDTLAGFENLEGTAYADSLVGDAGDNSILGGAGNDTIEGGAGNDYLYGGTGSDTVVYSTAGAGVTVNLLTGTATGGAGNDTLLGCDNIRGSTYDDLLTGDNNANTLWGGNGNDSLVGNGGNDVLDGGAGNDTLWGNGGNDTFIGGAGNDTFYVTDAGDVVSENAGEGTDWVYTSINYTLTSNVENLASNSGSNLTLTGNTLSNTIIGGTGNDTLVGSSGSDSLFGGAGNDVFSLSVTQLQNTWVYGGSTNSDGGNGTADTLKVADWNLSTNLDISKIYAIDAIDIRNTGTNVTTSTINYNTVQGILDSASGTGGKLVLWLDNGDAFTYTGSQTGTGTQTYASGSGVHQNTYTYYSGPGFTGNSHQVEVHWG
ncbi:MAG: hypothetical protein ACM3Q1_01835 [Bacteroidales bacterium]